MRWTKTKPSEPGWWWYRDKVTLNQVPRCILVVDDDGVLRAYSGGWNVMLQRDPGEWSSEPIPEPEESDES